MVMEGPPLAPWAPGMAERLRRCGIRRGWWSGICIWPVG
jgi:hypothetical protein